MCGIAGILKFDGNKVDPHKVKAMTDTLQHRGPDGEGLYVNQKESIALGHRRLSIIDLSTAGKQPFESEDGRYILTFNGEIYNYIELKQQLEKMGESFVSSTDTEVLLKMFIHYQADCLSYLDGMFAFVIWDNKKQELFCARDRFGEKPFFYNKDEQQFVFASEIKAIWTAGITKNVDSRKCYDYLLYGTVRDSKNPSATFYENIKELPAAHFMRLTKDGEKEIKKYWDIDLSSEESELSFEAAVEKYREMFSQSVSRRLRSDVTVGSSLSGGIDSSSIVCLIDELKSKDQKQKTFSARFKNFERDEGKFIAEVLAKCPSIDPYEIYPTEESSFNNLQKIIYHQDEPFNSLSIAAQFEVMQKAAQENVVVLMDGQGADEYLAGYRSFHETYLSELKRNKSLNFDSEVAAFEKNTSFKYIEGGWRAQLKAKNAGLYERIGHLRRKNTSPSDSYFMGIHPELVKEYRSEDNPNFKPTTLKGQLKHALLGKGIGDLLRYADRNSMANSIEVRLPFLDHKLIEFVFTLPNEFLIQEGWTKYLLRKSMEDILPEKICWRKDKVGFRPPQEKWMQEKKYQDLLQNSKQELIDKNVINKTYAQLDWQYIMLASYL